MLKFRSTSTTMHDPDGPACPRAMLPYFTDRFGTPQPQPQVRLEAEEPSRSRASRSPTIGASPKESSSRAAPPSRTTLRSRRRLHVSREGRHIITAVTSTRRHRHLKRLEKEGFAVSYCGEERRLIDLDQLRPRSPARRRHSIMRRTTRSRAPAIGEMRHCEGKGILFHHDAVQQWEGAVRLNASNVHMASLTAHRSTAEGVARCMSGAGTPGAPDPIIDGGGHERGMRSARSTSGHVGSASGRDLPPGDAARACGSSAARRRAGSCTRVG